MISLEEVATEAGRLASFNGPQQLAKRRASSSKKKAPSAVSWPHKTPAAEDLARAGFYYKPSASSVDSVTCFLCEKSLDGWEEQDDPIKEHLSHVPDCGWAVNVSIGQRISDDKHPQDNPMNGDLVEARLATFRGAWPHDGKRGWKCTSKKLAHAGWCYSPIPEADDCVVCFYCNCSLDGWEPKDDPWDEHHRRAPECPFFELIEQSKPTKATRGKKTAKSRSSKASRLSAQSNSTMLGDDELQDNTDLASADEGDTIATVNSTSTKSRKQAAPKKAKATRKTKQSRSDSLLDDAAADLIDDAVQGTEKPVEAPKKTRSKRGTQSKKQDAVAEPVVDEVVKQEDNSTATKPARKPRTKKASAATEKSSFSTRTEVESDAIVDGQVDEQQSQSPPPPPPQETLKSRKRSSDGLEKSSTVAKLVMEEGEEEEEAAAAAAAAPRIPTKSPRRLAKKTREASSQSAHHQIQATVVTEAEQDFEVIESHEPAPKSTPAKSTRRSSTRLQAQTSVAEASDEQGLGVGQDDGRERLEELHVSPAAEVQIFQDEAPSPRRSPSAQSSDAENRPPSSRPSLHTPPVADKESTRIPLSTAQTPRMSPSKRNIAGGLVSSIAWQAIDVDAMIARSPALKALGRENVKLEDVLKVLSSPEKKMTVEEWMLHNAHQSEEQLRAECERMISLFENEGNKALRSLEGIHVV